MSSTSHDDHDIHVPHPLGNMNVYTKFHGMHLVRYFTLDQSGETTDWLADFAVRRATPLARLKNDRSTNLANNMQIHKWCNQSVRERQKDKWPQRINSAERMVVTINTATLYWRHLLLTESHFFLPVLAPVSPYHHLFFSVSLSLRPTPNRLEAMREDWRSVSNNNLSC